MRRISFTANPKFRLGDVYVTPRAMKALGGGYEAVAGMLRRHEDGDWGDVVNADRQANDQALQDGMRLFSTYHSENGTKFWVITEADRSATTLLLPDEY